MKLSIVIVNYNVKYFLEQTLDAVFRSDFSDAYEVFVVDNASSDNSLTMVQSRFPQVQIIANLENVGFSTANNQAIKKSKGEFVLLLNPDTIISEDTLSFAVRRMEKDLKIGALGVKMIDGGGNFLPESKRGLPTPKVAFFKAFGLSKLFPKSSYFNKYHLGHLDENEEHEIDVLCGAFMLMRREVLDEVGLLDEQFFMYGEDVDLSYRIQKGGYKVWYYPDTTMVHFKGESTKKGSLNYVKIFYQAMVIFAEKHFVGNGAYWMKWVFQFAIAFRAVIDIVKHWGKMILPVLIEILVLFFGLKAISLFWATNYFKDADYYNLDQLNWHLGAYTFIWIFSLFLGGSYDKYFSLSKVWKSLVVGTALLLMGYALLENEWRPSRAMLGFGLLWALGAISLIRLITRRIVLGSFIKEQPNKTFAIVGSIKEIERTEFLLSKSGIQPKSIIKINVEETLNEEMDGNLSDLKDIVSVNLVEEVIFCSRDISAAEIMHWMQVLGKNAAIKIIPEEGSGILGSRHKNKKGELYAIDAKLSISLPEKRRQKRLFDVLMSLILLGISPLIIWFVKNKGGFLRNIVQTIFGVKTWVGYTEDPQQMLPSISPGVVHPLHDEKDIDEDLKNRSNYLYAKDYGVGLDLEILRDSLRYLGN